MILIGVFVSFFVLLFLDGIKKQKQWVLKLLFKKAKFMPFPINKK